MYIVHTQTHFLKKSADAEQDKKGEKKGPSSCDTTVKWQRRDSDPGAFDLRAGVLCSSHPPNPSTPRALGSGMPLAQSWKIGRQGKMGLLGTFLSLSVPCPPRGQLRQGKAKLKAMWGVPKLSFIRSRGYLFSMQCKFPCLKTWNLVQLCLDQCPTPFKFWRKLLLSKVQTCQTQ